MAESITFSLWDTWRCKLDDEIYNELNELYNNGQTEPTT